MAGQITIDQLPVGGNIADDDSFISVQTYNGSRRTTRLPGSSIKTQLKGDAGPVGPVPNIGMVGDQVAVNGQPIGPHLTGPQGPSGSGTSSQGYLVKNISAGFYYPSAEDVFTVLLNTFSVGGGVTGPADCVCYLPSTSEVALPIGSEIQMVDKNVADGSVTYFMGIGSAVVHTIDGAGKNVACAKSWDPIRAIKVTDNDWVIFGDTAPVTPAVPLTPCVVTNAYATGATSFIVNWGSVDVSTTSQIVNMNVAGSNTVISTATMTGSDRTATLTPSLFELNMPWQPFDFFVTEYATNGKLPAVSNKVQASAGYPTFSHKVTSATVVAANASSSGKVEVTLSTALLAPFTSADASAQGINGYTVELVGHDDAGGSAATTSVVSTGFNGGALTNVKFTFTPTSGYFLAGQSFDVAVLMHNKYGTQASSQKFTGSVLGISPPISRPSLASAQYSWSAKTLTLNFSAPWVYDAKDVITYLSATMDGYMAAPSPFTVTSYNVNPSGSTSYIFTNVVPPASWLQGSSGYAYTGLIVGNQAGYETVASMFTVKMVA